MNILHTQMQQLLSESKVAEVNDAFKKLKQLHSFHPSVKELEEEVVKLNEELSTGDWGRIGVVAGLLWYKLDSMIKWLSDNNAVLKNIERNTSHK